MTKPPPFKRPSVDMDRHGRVWKCVNASTLKKGDVVRDKGLVVLAHFHKRVQQTEVGYVNGDTEIFEPGEEIFAFVRNNESSR